jgi:hypothetical protein
MPKPRQHHVLPSAYLAGFTKTQNAKGRLHVLDYLRRKTYFTTPEKASRERDFYRIYKPGVDGNIVEKDFARLESETIPILQKVVRQKRFESPADLGTVLSFVSLTHLRGKRAIDSATETSRRTMRKKLREGEVTKEQWNSLRDYEIRAGVDPNLIPHFEEAQRRVIEKNWLPKGPEWIKPALAGLTQYEFAQMLVSNRIWSLAIADTRNGGFVTSDTPLQWGNRMPWEFVYSAQQITDPGTVLTFPLSWEVALITREDKHGSYKAVDEVVAWVNTRTLFGSMGLTYSESPDFLLMKADNRIGRNKDYLKYLNEAWSRGILNP